MSLSSIVLMLQLVLTLLSSPATAHNPQVQALASQAINEATIAIESQTTTTLPLPTPPITSYSVTTPQPVASTPPTQEYIISKIAPPPYPGSEPKEAQVNCDNWHFRAGLCK